MVLVPPSVVLPAALLSLNARRRLCSSGHTRTHQQILCYTARVLIGTTGGYTEKKQAQVLWFARLARKSAVQELDKTQATKCQHRAQLQSSDLATTSCYAPNAALPVTVVSTQQCYCSTSKLASATPCNCMGTQ
jgi:hypothetical protein